MTETYGKNILNNDFSALLCVFRVFCVRKMPITEIPRELKLMPFPLKKNCAACLKQRATETPVSVAFVDIDNFLRINNDHGHSGSDDVLKTIADLLR